MWRKTDVIRKLKDTQGGRSLRAFARSLGCSPAYVSDVYNGRREPGQKLLDSINIEKHTVVKKTVTYKEKRWR